MTDATAPPDRLTRPMVVLVAAASAIAVGNPYSDGQHEIHPGVRAVSPRRQHGPVLLPPRGCLARVLGRLGRRRGKRGRYPLAPNAPCDRDLTELIIELSDASADFRRRWASHDVHRHSSGV